MYGEGGVQGESWQVLARDRTTGPAGSCREWMLDGAGTDLHVKILVFDAPSRGGRQYGAGMQCQFVGSSRYFSLATAPNKRNAGCSGQDMASYEKSRLSPLYLSRSFKSYAVIGQPEIGNLMQERRGVA